MASRHCAVSACIHTHAHTHTSNVSHCICSTSLLHRTVRATGRRSTECTCHTEHITSPAPHYVRYQRHSVLLLLPLPGEALQIVDTSGLCTNQHTTQGTRHSAKKKYSSPESSIKYVTPENISMLLLPRGISLVEGCMKWDT